MTNRILKVITFFTGGVFSLTLTAVTVYFVYTYAMTGFEYGKGLGKTMTEIKPAQDVEIVLEDDATLDDVATILADKGVIENAVFFKLENLLKGTDAEFDGGTFVVNTSMDSNELVSALHKAYETTTDVKITIPEGYSLPDIAVYLESKEIMAAQDFIDACNTGEFNYRFLGDVPERENRLEGYLFPDTYMITPNATPNEIINKMLTRFEEMYDAECRRKAEDLGLTMDEVITMASIIEKEVKLDSERAAVSAIIRNRLEADMPLQMCSTVIYVLDKPKSRITEADLKVKSPYNTYMNKGLPAGPITNPGKACILAALNPDDSDVLYFVLKDEEMGNHLFTNDYDEFLKAKDIYNQIY